MEPTKKDIITIATMVDGEARTTTMAIAEGTENQHKNVMELVRTYQKDIEEFGRVAFQTRPFQTAGGTQKREIALLNEPQATLLLTYMRNSEIVRGFKKRLVKAFYELRQAAWHPSASDPILMLAQATQMLRQEQLAMQGQVAALESKTSGIEMEQESINDDLEYTKRQVRALQAIQPKLTLGMVSNPITLRLHSKGMTVRQWATKNGFEYTAVRNVISGLSQKEAIKRALDLGGLLSDEEDLF